jgi:hypothetical protein
LRTENDVKIPDRRRCEFFLLRYVPDAVKDEFVNVGVVMTEADGGYAEVRFTADWKRVRCLDPDADIETLEGMEQEIRERLHEGGANREWLLKRMEDTFSNAIRLTPAKAVLAESPEEELGRLAEMYLERKRRGGRVISGRQQIVSAMRGAFEKQGVWELMRHNIAASDYTHKGDPLKLDCGYRPNGTVHLYQAVSLETDVNMAKVLAFSFPKLREGIFKVEKAQADLTAVVEEELPRDDAAVAFALAVLRGSDITVTSVAEMPRIAESVRQQMGM